MNAKRAARLIDWWIGFAPELRRFPTRTICQTCKGKGGFAIDIRHPYGPDYTFKGCPDCTEQGIEPDYLSPDCRVTNRRTIHLIPQRHAA